MRFLRSDLGYAVRWLRRHPGFTAVVVLTLSLGIGANATVFTLLNALFLRPLPYQDAGSLRAVFTSNQESPYNSVSNPDYRDLRQATADIAEMAAFSGIEVNLDSGNRIGLESGEIVSGNFFSLLGTHPAAGRFFLTEEDEVPDRDRVLVLSHSLWRDRWNEDPSVIGRDVGVNGAPYTIVGVAPRGFHSPVLDRDARLWIPLAMQRHVNPASADMRGLLGSADLLENRATAWLRLLIRPVDGATVQEVAARLDAAAVGLAEEYPESNQEFGMTLTRIGEEPGLRSAARPVVLLLFGVAASTLLIVCANVANLLFVQASSRRHEFAVRQALGAGTGRLAVQLLTESGLLAILGGAAGLLVALWGSQLLNQLELPASTPLRIDHRVLGFTLLVSAASALFFGGLPAFMCCRNKVLPVLQNTSVALTGNQRQRTRNWLVVSQLALSLSLLVGAGLFLRTLQEIWRIDPGFEAEQVLLVSINLDLQQYAEQQGRIVQGSMLEAVRALPGVVAASLSSQVPLSGRNRRITVRGDGPGELEEGLTVYTNTVSDSYFSALGIPVLEGNDFDPTAPSSGIERIIVNKALARQLAAAGRVLGQRLVWAGQQMQVIGVVGDTRDLSLRRAPPAILYRPLNQAYEADVTLQVKARGQPGELAESIRSRIHQIDRQVPLNGFRTLRDEARESTSTERANALLLSVCASLALTLAAIGLYGVMAFSTEQRRKEIGLRMALGATQAEIYRLVVGRGMLVALGGVVLGLLLAAALSRLLASFLFGIAGHDPLTFGISSAVLALVALLACFFPARRAARVDASEVLRYQ